MASPPASPSPKRGVRSYFREKYNHFVRSQSRSPSQQSIQAKASDFGAQSQQTSSIVGDFLAPPLSGHVTSNSLQHAQSDSQISSNSKIVTLSGLQSALEGLRSATAVFPPLESAVNSLISVLDVLESSSKTRSEYEAIASELKMLSESLTRHMRDSGSSRMSDCIANVALGIEQQAKMISGKRGRRTGTRLVEARTEEDEVVNHYRKIEALFRQLQTDANLSMWSVANEHLANTRLEGLMPAKMANYDSKLSTEISRRSCTEGTRTAILSEMNDWSLNLDAPDLYLMSGMAGTGKTTIACSFSNRLEERKQLAASFFCTRTSPECRDASRIVPTIAYQLARYSIPFQSALCEVLGRDPDIGTKNIVKQFERLLKAPLLRVKEAIPENLVVVIDALDECEDRHAVILILELLFKFAPELPLKFFATSRPEPEIYANMVLRTQDSRTVLHLHEIEKSLVQADIELYLSEELQSISPTPPQIRQLAEQSGSLFIYAATLVRYIRLGKQSANPQKRLRAVLGMAPEPAKKHVEIDALYKAILQSALDEEDLESEEVDDVRLVLWAALCVQEPVPAETLAALTGLNDVERVLSALQPLRSVLHYSEHGGLVSTLHASFPDFMFSQERSGLFFCDQIQHNRLITRQCFDVMKQRLRFNICNLESSFIPDTKVKGLEGRIEKAISSALAYACRYWGDHLRLSGKSDNLCDLLNDFLSNRLLFWMEVLSLKREIATGTEILVHAKQWLNAHAMSPDLVRFAEDAQTFVTSYAANSVSQSTPHIYMSSLPLCPRSSLVFKQYWERTRGLVELNGTGMVRRETAALATWKIGSPVRTISYSSDGSRVAFGCKNGTIGVRNAYNGSAIIGPFKGHNDIVWSVAFSPDGTRFVSGSDDRTIKIWDAQDGTLITVASPGHDAAVKAVAFSPDGRLIASGSADQNVRIWSAANGTSIGEPLRGHQRWVWSVAFSPDSSRIVSGSSDRTIRIWNTQDGTAAIPPIGGHTDTIWSVRFSPDGARIVSGSADHTIRIWSSQSGSIVAGPFEGHPDEIHSVSFSPDGARVASCSRDHTIRVWGSHDGRFISGPFEDHTDVVWSGAFSPDGTRLVTGSGDNSIRVWNTRTSTVVTNRSEGHTNGAWSVTFTPDGTRIASGSADHSVRLWSARDGSPDANPMKGHTGIVRSVAISPDGKYLASGSDDRTVRVWNLSDGAVVAGPLKGHTEAVCSVAFSPDSSRVVSGSSDRTVRVWMFDGTPVGNPFKGHTNVIRSVAVSPDGTRIASASFDRTVRIWQADSGAIVGDPLKGHTDWVNSVAFSPCGKHLVSGSKDRTVRTWNTHDGTPLLCPFTGHTGMINAVGFSPDGTRIVSGSDDHSVWVWAAQNGDLIAGPFYGHTDWVTSTMFSPDGTQIVSCSSDSTIRMWDLTQVRAAPPSILVFDPSSGRAIRRAASVGENWTVKEDGWIMDKDKRLLFWVPPQVLRSLLTSHCLFIIGRSGTIEMSMDNTLLGQRWHECYLSR
ncbi:hypothetical protein CTheo_2986 [Ceratobasidium theobromae]|uniref:NACHT domain-containing protein n=1 Tax=Ceratobasidium theobromae TaxID=1582974 RepID=A0A5N5QQU6_9AGAM|nr:hypothetical protein CTheo_2986 [Ceratobasidium theobromae]